MTTDLLIISVPMPLAVITVIVVGVCYCVWRNTRDE